MARLTGSTGGMNIIKRHVLFPDDSPLKGNGLADQSLRRSGLDWYFAGMADVLFNKTNGKS